MSMHDLPRWLLANHSFSRKLKNLTLQSVAQQFNLTRPIEQLAAVEDDMGYMLTCASVLAHSREGQCQDAALRIAQYCLQNNDTPLHRRDGAAFILDALVNRTAIQLAEKRNIIDSNFEDRIPSSAHFESTKRRIHHTVELADKTKIVANKFQISFWEAAQAHSWISVSAPTSVGKSFIMETWLQDYLASHMNHLVVYLVPTRALISEVESDLKRRLDPDGVGLVNIATLPLQNFYIPGKPNVLVFTQERFHIFLNAREDAPRVDVLIVDEAHKIGDNYRGVFLQQVIELTNHANPDAKVIFASPFTNNPELLLEDAPLGKSFAIKSSDVTVNQNLIWATQQPSHPKKWELSLCLPDEVLKLGSFELENSPGPISKRLPFVALALSQGTTGNIIYVNGAADAEKTAQQIYNCLPENPHVDSEVAALIELCVKTIHPKFLLNTVLRRGVAFHYGNMPLLVKAEIERLFSANKLSYLICTSTLVEGVNMSCRNIFMRGPKKGSKSLMNAEDFWNLAGRAGRWGKEFQGNIICVDADHSSLWLDGAPPRQKSGVRIKRTTDTVIKDASSLLDYINSEGHLQLSAKQPELEHVFSYLTISRIRYGSLNNSPFLSRQEDSSISALDDAIASVLDEISFPAELIARNPGISPILMESLFNRFSKDPNRPAERLLLSDPSSDDVLESYVAAFTRISAHLSPKLGFTSKQAYIRALLVVRWMRGLPLARLISERIQYLRRKEDPATEPSIIRDVMKDVEEIARYHAPRLLSCYNDLLGYYLGSIGRVDLQNNVRDLSVYLELGLSQQTQLSLVGMGLSRTAAVMISELIPEDDFNSEQCTRWLGERKNWQDSDMPLLVITELENALQGYLRKSGIKLEWK